MNIERGKTRDGRMVIIADPPFPKRLAVVTYHVDQRLVVLGYADGDDELMHYEIGAEGHSGLGTADEILVVVQRDGQLSGYTVPLRRIGGGVS